RVTSFAQITSNTDLQAKLSQLYGSVDKIDAWVGALAEDHVRGSTGPLVRAVLVDQFRRLRDGDRFWYQRAFAGQGGGQREGTTLADTLRRNTTLTNLQANTFFFKVSISGTVSTGLNRNGPRNALPQGVPGVTVQLQDDSGAVIGTTVTDS